MPYVAHAVESKVYGATIGAGAGLTVSKAVLWALGVFVWNASGASDTANEAVAAVPSYVADLVYLIIGIGGTFAGGWLARHTPRPTQTEDAPSEASEEAPVTAPEGIAYDFPQEVGPSPADFNDEPDVLSPEFESTSTGS